MPTYRPVDLKVSTHEDWTVSDLAVMVERWYGVVYEAEESYVRLLKESWFSYQRSTKAYRHQSSAAVLLEIEAALEKSDRLLQDHPDGQVIAMDEMSLYLPPLTSIRSNTSGP